MNGVDGQAIGPDRTNGTRPSDGSTAGPRPAAPVSADSGQRRAERRATRAKAPGRTPGYRGPGAAGAALWTAFNSGRNSYWPA